MDSTIRYRKPETPAEKAPPVISRKRRTLDNDDEDDYHGISLLDCVRVVSGLLLLSCLLSWFITDGESATWGYRPRITRWRTLKSLFVSPIALTDAELAQYNGEDPTKPIYVAVNGSIFDVSANPQAYGPIGGYHFFAGRDAARAFVSGCFKEDLTYDLRGVEEQFIEGEERHIDEKEFEEIQRLEATETKDPKSLKDEESIRVRGRLRYLKRRREKRRAEARKQVEATIKHWDNFFRDHDRYFYVGRVEHESLEGKPILPVCNAGKGKPS